MKIALTWVLVLWGVALQVQAQSPALPNAYTDAQVRYRLQYPRQWRVYAPGGGAKAVFYAGSTRLDAPALVQLSEQPAPAAPAGTRQLAASQLDSLRRRLRSLPQVRIHRLDSVAGGAHPELRYDYSYAAGPDTAVRAHLLGRLLWHGGREFWLEYRAATEQDGAYLAAGQALLESFALVLPTPAVRRPRPTQRCDDKMYGIVALRYRNERWEDDCRSIHEFATQDPGAAPRVHREVLPFQSYALAKGFDNRLYSATKAPTNHPEYVYCYDPATRRGHYTPWQLPAQGPDVVWISAATDLYGDLYFMTSDANKLVKISPQDSTVQLLWAADPARLAPYYAALRTDGASTHGNFGLDETDTLYQIYSADGSLVRINLVTGQPAPALTQLAGLPRRGGYSDLLFQRDATGQRRLYLAGATALYEVDLERRQARYVRRGIYTDLAGCNVFQPPLPAATWQGRVLDARTRQPLLRAQLRVRAGATDTLLRLAPPDGAFVLPAVPGRTYAVHAQQAGYLATDTTFQLGAGWQTHDVLLQPLAVGTTLRLRNVQFEQGTTRLLPASYPALDQLLALLNANPTLTIELRGHTDNVGDPQKNLQLSEQRVAAVKIYLVGLGIAEKRISGLGLGGTEPLASNAREATRRLNRRVEFRVTGGQ